MLKVSATSTSLRWQYLEKDEESGCAATPNGNSSFPVPHSSLKNVLLIDDDRIQLTLTAAMLQQSGINSVSCLQLDELLDALRTATFDVLLTDVQMPATLRFKEAFTVSSP